uniref:Uncharacterized protein n=1 Tax=Picea glauca TaxID=3330 RepID=A0A124GP81_PICGL|nr:hypothetical protein ABT39_MTgene972 [Picea glauca]
MGFSLRAIISKFHKVSILGRWGSHHYRKKERRIKACKEL